MDKKKKKEDPRIRYQQVYWRKSDAREYFRIFIRVMPSFYHLFQSKNRQKLCQTKKNPPLKSAEIIIIFNLDSNQLTFTSSIRSDIFNRQLKSHRLGCNGPKTFELPIRSIEFGFEIRRWFMLYSNSQYSRQVRRASKASTSMVALCKTIVTAVALFKFQFPFLAVQVVHETRPKMNLMLSTSGHQTGYWSMFNGP